MPIIGVRMIRAHKNANIAMTDREPEYTARIRKKKRRDVDVVAAHSMPHIIREVLRMSEPANPALAMKVQMQYARLVVLERRVCINDRAKKLFRSYRETWYPTMGMFSPVNAMTLTSSSRLHVQSRTKTFTRLFSKYSVVSQVKSYCDH